MQKKEEGRIRKKCQKKRSWEAEGTRSRGRLLNKSLEGEKNSTMGREKRRPERSTNKQRKQESSYLLVHNTIGEEKPKDRGDLRKIKRTLRERRFFETRGASALN